MIDTGIPIRGLEVNVVYNCNLKCEYCTHLSKYLDGHVCVDEIAKWYATWHKLLVPQQVRVIGGEPLLHPELPIILRLTRQYWNRSELQLITNGLLLSNQAEDVLTALLETNTLVTISRHTKRPEFTERQAAGTRLLKKYGIRYEVRLSNKWLKSYRLEGSRKILPYSSDPSKAWNNCFVKHQCMTLMNNTIYKCPQLACFHTHSMKDALEKNGDFC